MTRDVELSPFLAAYADQLRMLRAAITDEMFRATDGWFLGGDFGDLGPLVAHDHPRHRTCVACQGRVAFTGLPEVRPGHPALERLRQRLPESISITVLGLPRTCVACDRDVPPFVVALAEVEWQGLHVERTYALEIPGLVPVRPRNYVIAR